MIQETEYDPAAASPISGRLLSTLKNANGKWMTEREVGRRTELTGLLLDREIDRLRAQGYDIECSDSRIRLLNAPDLLHADEIRERLDTKIVGREVVVYDETDSTNDAAWRLTADGAAEGLVVLAERQTSGRGRLGRTWCSGQGGLWMSVMLRPQTITGNTTIITIAASVAVAKAVRKHTGCAAAIRWPNDILIGRRKLAGLMVETRSAANLTGKFILGIGVNVNQPELPSEIEAIATTLSRETERVVLRSDLACEILRQLDEIYLRVEEGEHNSIGAEWKAMSSTIGQRITMLQNGRTYSGEVVDLDPVAGLMVRLKSGFVRSFKGEHITVVK